MSPLRLLSIIEAQTITGPAKNLLKFSEYLCHASSNPSIHVMIATFQRGKQSSLFADTVRRSGIPFWIIPEEERFDRGVILHLRRLIDIVKPDVIQTHAVKSHFLVRVAGLHRVTPWIAFHHGYTWPDTRMRLYNQLDRWSLRGARRVITVNQPFKQDLIRRGVQSDRIDVVHNAIDTDWGSATRLQELSLTLRAKLGIPSNKKIILMVGRLSAEKDPLSLIRATQRLRTGFPEGTRPHLVIVGDGPQRQGLESAVLSMALVDDVTFVGHVASAEPYYGIADVCVLSSLSEGSPNALLEAMAANVPVVATTVGGIPEIVAHEKSALLVKPRDIDGMAKAITRILTDPELARTLSERAFQLIQTQHTPEAHTRQLQRIYQSVFNPRVEKNPL